MLSDWAHDEASTFKRKDRARIFEQLDFDITHRCDRNCPRCNLVISTSPFEYLTLEQFAHVRRCVTTPIKRIKFAGGEPLVHPQFVELVETVDRSFGQVPILVLTNGGRLAQVPAAIFERCDWRLTDYGAWNAQSVRTFGRRPNVLLFKHAPFADPLRDPGLPEAEARRARERCMFSVRVIGDRLHGCCLSDMHERTYGEPGLSAPFDERWQERWDGLETWRACRHCGMLSI